MTGKKVSDDCGIIVAGVSYSGNPGDWRAVVLEDATVSSSSPLEWAEATIAAYERHGAGRIVAEVNQGGDLVTTVLRTVAPLVPIREVRASKGKAARAEPVAALYEQGRVKHMRGLSALEEQMGRMSIRGYAGPGSPDRVDALVWALTELMIEPALAWRSPRIRTVG